MQDDSKEKKYAFTEVESNTNYQRLYDIRLCIFATCDEYTIFLRRSKFIKFFGENNFFRFFLAVSTNSRLQSGYKCKFTIPPPPPHT